MARMTKDQHRQQFEERRKKALFEFYDGTKERRVDVMAVMIAIQSQIPLEMVEANAASGEGVGKLIEVVRTALNIPKWDEEKNTGMTDGEVFHVFEHLTEFIGAEKKNTKLKPTLPRSTAQAS